MQDAKLSITLDSFWRDPADGCKRDGRGIHQSQLIVFMLRHVVSVYPVKLVLSIAGFAGMYHTDTVAMATFRTRSKADE